MRLVPTKFEALLHDGLVAMQVKKDTKLARQFFEEASFMEPDNYLPFLYGSPVSPDPVSYLLKAIELKPDSLKAWILLGEEFTRRAKIREAFECFETAVKVYPNYEIPFLRAATLLQKLGKKTEVGKLFERATNLAIYPPSRK